MKKIFVVALAGSLSLGACNPAANNTQVAHNDEAAHAEKEHEAAHGAAHWSYVGEESPEKWNQLCTEYTACGGQHQSPINIVAKEAFADNNLKPLELKYKSTHAHIINNGHTVQFSCDEGNKVVANGKEYQLKQFHFHTSSEHEMNGDHFPMEVHFVHQAEDGSLAVVGVFFKEGETNEFLGEYLESTPHTEGEFEGKTEILLAKLMPHNASYYHYDGSLTTPPCSEIVSWYLMDEPLTVSNTQLAEIHAILHDNFRPVQPLNDRKLTHYAAN